MKTLFHTSFISILMIHLAQGAYAQEPRHNLMPTPADVRFQSGRLGGLAVGKSFSVAVRGHNDQRLESGINRALRRLEGRIGLELRRGLAPDPATATLVIECREAGQSIPSPNEDESYSLEVSDKQAALKAATVIGALRGLETFLQLPVSDSDGYYVPS